MLKPASALASNAVVLALEVRLRPWLWPWPCTLWPCQDPCRNGCGKWRQTTLNQARREHKSVIDYKN